MNFINATHINRHFCEVQGRRGPRSNTTATANSHSGRGRGEWKTKEEEGRVPDAPGPPGWSREGQTPGAWGGWHVAGRTQDSSREAHL